MIKTGLVTARFFFISVKTDGCNHKDEMMKCAKMSCCASLVLLSFNALAQCPDMTGSYRFSGADSPFYLVKISGQSTYHAYFPAGSDKYVHSRSVDVPAEKRKEEQIPACALLLKGAGMLVKMEKGKKINTMSQSQNYMTEKTITTDYGLMVYSGFASDFIGVDKLSAHVPKEALNNTLPIAKEMAE
ncbi:TPA: hypothetical protein QIC20_004536 [Klebsiella aerogenes]|uniref:hypothetical protein n=1 Tax=Klebsiella aerogenes TaxID=548 RepID=UPI002788B7EC|nr:hypothetical protein [Klebsiella aerogenes]MDY0848480.1 hypothetical protein [Klebsiella aerogenes]WPS31702.1 hypothetical protein SM905_15970 [Klebsiella aerogenes]HBV6393054.1 hypothetical protein [Klebsiella aerogenes]HDT0783128.1 hypothetical protein [Klebsiella aerogenes]HDU4318868.1 hypothetical protein [Klebsiella aerogenes]